MGTRGSHGVAATTEFHHDAADVDGAGAAHGASYSPVFELDEQRDNLNRANAFTFVDEIFRVSVRGVALLEVFAGYLLAGVAPVEVKLKRVKHAQHQLEALA